MKTLFKKPALGQRVILSHHLPGEESEQRIVKVTAKSIHVSSCNMHRFNRDGSLNKKHSQGGLVNASIRPVDT